MEASALDRVAVFQRKTQEGEVLYVINVSRKVRQAKVRELPTEVITMGLMPKNPVNLNQ